MLTITSLYIISWLTTTLTGTSDRSMTDDKLYTSLSANTIMAKLWRRLPLWLSKHQSPTTVLFRTTLTQAITLCNLYYTPGSKPFTKLFFLRCFPDGKVVDIAGALLVKVRAIMQKPSMFVTFYQLQQKRKKVCNKWLYNYVFLAGLRIYEYLVQPNITLDLVIMRIHNANFVNYLASP